MISEQPNEPNNHQVKPPWRQALDQFVVELHQMYASRLDRVILYGSRARGDASEDSDIDVLVVLRPLGDFWEELSRLDPLAGRISLDKDVVISAIPVDVAEIAHPRDPFMMNSQREGLVVG